MESVIANMRARVQQNNDASVSAWVRKWRKVTHRVVILLQIDRYKIQLQRMGYPVSYLGEDGPCVFEMVHGTKPAKGQFGNNVDNVNDSALVGLQAQVSATAAAAAASPRQAARKSRAGSGSVLSHAGNELLVSSSSPTVVKSKPS
jgi:hypothetical protein